MPKVKLVSDGTPGGTQVLVDGQPIDTTHVKFEIGMREHALVTLTCYVDEVEIDGEMAVEKR